jgi:phosphatidate cytidylyltransferase
VAGVLALALAFVGFGRLILIEVPIRGAGYVFYLLLIIWAADIGAYFAGRAFGRLKLAPQVSPNKSWEGLLGGLAGGLALALAGAAVLKLPLLASGALGLAVVIASVVGDLTESMFKRHAGLKDSGRLLPGHGGVLDRIDSLIAGVPFFALGLGWLGVLK